jgi:aryl-alcohol dehydrogenase-like predicted oxidoreductase
MEYVTLGRTGLRVSVAGLGCGGFSRLGLGTGKSEAEAVALDPPYSMPGLGSA